MTGILLDTNILLFLGLKSSRVQPAAIDVITDPRNDRFVSEISAIEMAIKSSLGKLPLPRPFVQDFAGAFRTLADSLAADVIGLSLDQIAQTRDLPLHHRDPFDRLLIAQALEGDLLLATRDRQFTSYGGLRVLPA